MALNRVPSPNWKPTENKEVGEGIDYDKREFVKSLEEVKRLNVRMTNILTKYQVNSKEVRYYFDNYGSSLAAAYEELVEQGE